MPENLIIPTAEPFLFPGDRTGCLVTHGFTGSPKEMRWIGEYLAQQGHTVLGVRLAGHATQPADMMHLHWQDWLASVEDGYNLLKCCTDRIFVIGLSMGAALSLIAAARYPVAGVVSISCPYEIPADWRMKIIKLLQYVKPEVEKGPPNTFSPEIRKLHVDYPRYPTRSIIELNELLGSMRSSLPKIHAPALLIQSHKDDTIPSFSMDRIDEELASSQKEKIWVENSGHVITEEPDRETAFKATEAFIQSVLQPAQQGI